MWPLDEKSIFSNQYLYIQLLCSLMINLCFWSEFMKYQKLYHIVMICELCIVKLKLKKFGICNLIKKIKFVKINLKNVLSYSMKKLSEVIKFTRQKWSNILKNLYFNNHFWILCFIILRNFKESILSYNRISINV